MEAEEKATVKAQIAGIQAGARPELYAGVFTELAAQRKALQERLDKMQAVQKPTPDPQTAAEKVAHALAELEEALTSETLTPAEKRSILVSVVKAVRPDTNNLGYWVDTYSSSWGLSETVQYISIR